MPPAAKPPRPRPDYQTDYEDPTDRLFRRPEQGGNKPKKRPNAVATVASALGYTSLIPCVGAVLGPIAIVLGVIGLIVAAQPNTAGKKQAGTGVWFGLVGCVLYIAIPVGFYIWIMSLR